MPDKLEERKQQILGKLAAFIKETLPASKASLFQSFVERYYEMVALEDIEPFTTEEIYSIVYSHWQIVSQRHSGELQVNIYNPSVEENGWQSKYTIIQIASDDMPFLLDSIRMEINRMDFLVHLVVHLGGFQVVRNEEDKIVKILTVGAYDKKAFSEAVIHLEIDKQTDPDVLSEIKENIERVLLDVSYAVSDWKKMQERLQEALTELEEAHVPTDFSEVAESKDFLRWIGCDHFTFLGSRDYKVIGKGEDRGLKIVPGSGLGVLRDDSRSQKLRKYSEMPEEARLEALSKRVLIVAKTNTHSTVHRPAYTDYIGIKRFNKQGEIVGERRFVGLYTSAAYNTNPKHIPFLRHKVAKVIQMSRFTPTGHAGKALLNILETMPRDDLFQASLEELYKLSIGILQLQERQRVRLFVRKDVYGRFYSCLVYVPRERFNTELRQVFEEILREQFQAREVTFSTRFSNSVLARIHFVVRVNPENPVHYDVQELEKQFIQASRSWRDDLRVELCESYGEEQGMVLFNQYKKTFPASYQEFYSPREALHDIVYLQKLQGDDSLGMDLHFFQDANEKHVVHFKVFNTESTMPLSDILPLLENIKLRVIGERPVQLRMSNKQAIWINDFELTYPDSSSIDFDAIKETFQDAFKNVWAGFAENDAFNALVLKAALSWREISVLRALAKYLWQVGFTFSQSYIEEAMENNPIIVKQLISLFDARFNPDKTISIEKAKFLREEIEASLESVSNRDEDRILRRYLDMIFAILRTNYYQLTEDGRIKDYISFKFDPESIPDLVLPKPMYEIFVYSPRVEGLHLRASKVARGGLRWSDRREDFRTEVLGLMKAQQVKNAVIVPSGAKGGFVAKQLPVERGRDLILEEVIRCYRTFICGLLDLTDNLENDKVVPPKRVVRYDDDDTYLVVAADKGTASFSDIANSIARDYGYWLDDAFASGGSVGYDHKKMGITARGAWVSVRRSFLELGLNTQTTDFTVVGIGDMSGDVFGNGMLQSPHIKLIGAFNHLHIFIDPDPNPKKSYKERKRLFKLPRSSWSDYDSQLISTGGGIFSRTDKFIVLTPEIKQLLNIDKDRLEPDELIKAMLCADIDLLWNGGIGTFVKAEAETDADAGDRTNDGIRVNAPELRCRVVGEGGNLGFTQLARIEYALKGGSMYTDFIDNSAGVDCSDHEVNIKILLNILLTENKMNNVQRAKLLAEMTQEVGELVLQNNYEQTMAISAATLRSSEDMDIYRRYIRSLEGAGKLDRKLEFLADDKVLLERKSSGLGLTKPEVSVLFAYTKNILSEEILLSDVPEDEFFFSRLKSEFPTPLKNKYFDAMKMHGLRREIITTQLTNNIINRTGVHFVHRLQQETGASPADIVRAYTIASNIFPVEEMFQDIAALDYKVGADVQFAMLIKVSFLVRRATRWFVRNRKRFVSIQETIVHFKKLVDNLIAILLDRFIRQDGSPFSGHVAKYFEENAPRNIAEKIALIPLLFFSLDIVDAVSIYKFPMERFVTVYFSLVEKLDLNWLGAQIRDEKVENHWEDLSRSLLLDDLDWQQCQLTVSVLQFLPKRRDVVGQLDDWMIMNDLLLERWASICQELKTTAESVGLIMYSVALRELSEFSQFGARPVRRTDLEDK